MEGSEAETKQNIFIQSAPDMHQMRVIGLLTEDPKTYFEIIETLREQDLKFVSLDFFDPIPANVGVVITTDADFGALRQVVHDEGFRSLAVPAGVGGRFSVLTPVGLFPTAVAGVRVDDLLAGAVRAVQRVDERVRLAAVVVLGDAQRHAAAGAVGEGNLDVAATSVERLENARESLRGLESVEPRAGGEESCFDLRKIRRRRPRPRCRDFLRGR